MSVFVCIPDDSILLVSTYSNKSYVHSQSSAYMGGQCNLEDYVLEVLEI